MRSWLGRLEDYQTINPCCLSPQFVALCYKTPRNLMPVSWQRGKYVWGSLQWLLKLLLRTTYINSSHVTLVKPASGVTWVGMWRNGEHTGLLSAGPPGTMGPGLKSNTKFPTVFLVDKALLEEQACQKHRLSLQQLTLRWAESYLNCVHLESAPLLARARWSASHFTCQSEERQVFSEECRAGIICTSVSTILLYTNIWNKKRQGKTRHEAGKCN